MTIPGQHLNRYAFCLKKEIKRINKIFKIC
jgi:hypothetical protein